MFRRTDWLKGLAKHDKARSVPRRRRDQETPSTARFRVNPTMYNSKSSSKYTVWLQKCKGSLFDEGKTEGTDQWSMIDTFPDTSSEEGKDGQRPEDEALPQAC